MLLMNASAACLAGSSLPRRTILSIFLTGVPGLASPVLLPVFCDRSLFQTLRLYFTMLPEPSHSSVRHTADTLCPGPRRAERNSIPIAVARPLVRLPLRVIEASFRTHDPNTLS